MCSYNRINGVYASQNDYLLNIILKQERGFEGAVVSDWGANHTIFESIKGGLDLEMPGPAKFYILLGEAVYRWQVDDEAIDKAARRILRLVLLSGHMDGTVSTDSGNTTAYQVLARNLAEEAVTLLKNEHNVLPITNKVKKIAVIGPNAADAVIAGGGSSHVDPLYCISPLEGLKELLGDKVEILYEQGCSNYDEASKDDRLKRAVAIARKADIALVFVGYPEFFETEGWDRPDMHLTGKQDELVSAVAEVESKDGGDPQCWSIGLHAMDRPGSSDGVGVLSRAGEW